MTDPSSERNPVEALAEEFVERHRRGERPSLTEYTDKYPDLADDIRDLFPALVKMEHLRPHRGDTPQLQPGGSASASFPEQLGDYRIVREIGRGGMGVVYEAEQQALGRRVALKVLLRPATQDAKVLARFRRESRAAAQLHHTNIVPVFDVGQQGDICYYAMQFFRGQALDDVVKELQRLRARSTPGAAKEAAPPAGPLAQSLWTGAFEPVAASGTVDHEPGPASAPVTAPRLAETTAAALPDQSELSSVTSNYQRYCRNVARLGLQVAQALAYAHARGIIHRDIKPANLLLDTTGVLWVSDFGLVKTQDTALTDTGDLVGTVRYMAPERFRGECDTRADVYALGLTLYELLVLRPAFDGRDRLHLVDQICRQEPARLRTLDARIPRDLETILMKAIEKDPRRRYPTADDLAEDLRRYLSDEPIKARRIGLLERLGRWGRRNLLVAGLSAAVVLVAVLGFAGVFGQMQVAQANEREAKQHAAQAEQQKREAKAERDEAQRQRDEVRALNERLQRTLYAAHMNLAQQAWEAGGPERVRELLEQHRPKPGDSDLRGFEWYYLYRLCHADLLTLKGHIGGIFSVAYSPDGKRLASAGHAGVQVWDAQTGQELLTVGGVLGIVVFSPDGKRLATTSGGPTVKVLDAQTGQEFLSLKVQIDGFPNSSVAFSPDSKRLATGSNDRMVQVWDAQTGQELLTCKGHTEDVRSVAFSPDGKRLASGSGTWDDTKNDSVAGEVKVWDAQSGKELLSLKRHTGSLLSVIFSPDGKRLASASDKEVKVWDAHTGQELLTLKGGSDSVAFSPDGKRLASAGEDDGIKVWDAQTGQELLALKGHNEEVTSVVFSPDGKRLASSSNDGTVKVWDAQTGPKPVTLQGAAASSVARVALSPDGKRLASGGRGRPGSGSGELKVWDARTGQEISSLQGHTAHVTTVAYSPDGKRLASSAGDKTVKVWDAQTGQELLTCKGQTSPVTSLAYSPDGKRLASGCDGEVKVWDAQTGLELLTFKGGSKSVAYSPDGKRLASAAWDHTVKVWDALTGQELLTCKGHTNGVESVAFSPDGNRLVSTGGGGLKVWDAQSGQELLTMKGGTAPVAFSPDGHWLASSAGDGTVTIWDATPLPEKP